MERYVIMQCQKVKPTVKLYWKQQKQASVQSFSMVSSLTSALCYCHFFTFALHESDSVICIADEESNIYMYNVYILMSHSKCNDYRIIPRWEMLPVQYILVEVMNYFYAMGVTLSFDKLWCFVSNILWWLDYSARLLCNLCTACSYVKVKYYEKKF